MSIPISDQTLQSFIDESLAAEHAAQIEQRLRSDPALVARLAQLLGERDAGVHTLGEIWRRHRLTCPTREQLGSYLLGGLMTEQREYIEFHLQRVSCRYCHANLADLQSSSTESPSTVVIRRQRYFQSSIGSLPKNKKK